MSQILSACVDIETSHLNADFGVILCAVIKGNGEKPVVLRGDKLAKDWANKRSDDSEIAKAIATEMSKYDIWIIHNGRHFDVPYIRTRLLRWGLPTLPERKLIDPVLLARNKLRMSFNGLAQLAELLGCNSKTVVQPDVWIRASLDGDVKAMDYIAKHCLEDVLTLEKITDRVKHLSTNFNTYGSGY